MNCRLLSPWASILPLSYLLLICIALIPNISYPTCISFVWVLLSPDFTRVQLLRFILLFPFFLYFHTPLLIILKHPTRMVTYLLIFTAVFILTLTSAFVSILPYLYSLLFSVVSFSDVVSFSSIFQFLIKSSYKVVFSILVLFSLSCYVGGLVAFYLSKTV